MAVITASKIQKRLRPTRVFAGPTNVLIEPTNICNLKCPGCPTGAGILTRDKGMMSLEHFKKITDMLSPSLERIMLWNYGEPFLNPRSFDMISYAREKGIEVTVSTNGHYLRNNVDKVVEAQPTKIMVSIDGASQESYDEYRKNGAFFQVMESLQELCEKRTSDIFVELQFIVMRHNEHEIDIIKTIGEEWGVDRVAIKNVWFLDQRLKAEYAHLVPKNKKYQRKLEGMGNCIKPWYHMVIQWDGDVAPCCFDANNTMHLGNILKDGLDGVWKGEKMKQFRKDMRKQIAGENVHPICRTCPERTARRVDGDD